MSKQQELQEQLRARRPLKSSEDVKKAAKKFVAEGGEPPKLEEPPKEEAKEEEAKKEEEEERKENEENIKNSYKSIPGAPSQEEIEGWKVQFGNVYVGALSANEVFIWRPLMREEYRNLRILMAENQGKMNQLDYEEMTVEMCLLFPDPENPRHKEYFDKLMRKAGVFSSLFEMIQQASHFMPPNMVGLFVAEL